MDNVKMEGYNRKAAGFVLDLNVFLPWCTLVCFWNQAQEELDINIAFLLPVFGGSYMKISSTQSHPSPIFTKNNLNLFSSFFLFPCNQMSYSPLLFPLFLCCIITVFLPNLMLHSFVGTTILTQGAVGN